MPSQQTSGSIANRAKKLARLALSGMGIRPAHMRTPRLSPAVRLRPEDVPTKVTIREDRRFEVNGKPFFPNGLYYADADIADPTGERLERLKALGFNLVFVEGGVERLADLDRIRRAGLFAWCRPPGHLSGDFTRLLETVSTLASHPALLFWEMDDEPLLNGTSLRDTSIGCRVVRAVDPWHPILCTQWLSSASQRHELRAWADLSDAWGFGAYPIPLSRWADRQPLIADGFPQSIAVVGRQTDFWLSVAPARPVMPVLQAFAFDAIEDGMSGFPTAEESRFMAYHAVIRGANGLRHFGVPFPDAPCLACGIPPAIREHLDGTHADFERTRVLNARFWDDHARVVREIGDRAHIFAASDAAAGPPPPRSKSEGGVEWRLKEVRDATVLLLVNSASFGRDVDIEIPRLAGRHLVVAGEDRTVDVTPAGVLRDTVDAFGVHVYAERPELFLPSR